MVIMPVSLAVRRRGVTDKFKRSEYLPAEKLQEDVMREVAAEERNNSQSWNANAGMDER